MELARRGLMFWTFVFVLAVLSALAVRVGWVMSGPGFERPAEAQIPDSEADQRERDACSQFASQAEAQSELDEDVTDPLGLDPDADAIACEDFFGTSDDPTGTSTTGGGNGSTQYLDDDGGNPPLMQSGGPEEGPAPVMPAYSMLQE